MIHFGELQQAVVTSRRNQSPVSIRIRFLELRPNLPRVLRDALTEVFVTNADLGGNKEARLEDKENRTEQDVRALNPKPGFREQSLNIMMISLNARDL